MKQRRFEMFDETEKTDLENDLDLQVRYKAAVQKYLLQCLLMEGSKIILFSIIFVSLGLTVQYITTLFVLMLVRCNGGGIHCKHYLSCFLVSLLVLAAGIFSGMYIPIYKFLSIPILILCSILGYLLVPIVSSNRPEPNESMIRQSKKRTLSIILIYCLLICVCPYNQYLNIGTWTIIIHILQLLFAKFLQRRSTHV